MRITNIVIAAALICAMYAITGCSHRLVGHGGEANVSVFPNKQDFDSVTSMKSRGGPEGIVGGLGESFMARKVPDQTRVKVLSSDSEGDEIQVLEGPYTGLRGYVAKDSVD